MNKILLIHGLARTSLSLLSLEWRLNQAGYETEHFGYTAFLESYSEIVRRLQKRLKVLSNQGNYVIVAHSLGGLLTRSALGDLSCLLPEQVIMLGTPNRLPRLAPLACKLPPFRWFTGECGVNLSNPNFFAQLPRLSTPYTIIAGTGGFRGFGSPFGLEVNDGIVALNETLLDNSNQPIELPVFHASMMSEKCVQEAVIQCVDWIER
jgi:hypothetical protein